MVALLERARRSVVVLILVLLRIVVGVQLLVVGTVIEERRLALDLVVLVLAFVLWIVVDEFSPEFQLILVIRDVEIFIVGIVRFFELFEHCFKSCL